jgi:hypothetical protein
VMGMTEFGCSALSGRRRSNRRMKSYQPPRLPPGRQALSKDRPNLLIFLPLSAYREMERQVPSGLGSSAAV